jgi:hypothetical protein
VDRRSSVLCHLVKQDDELRFVMSLGRDQQVSQGGLFIGRQASVVAEKRQHKSNLRFIVR